MSFDTLPNEIITQIFLHLPNITSTASLSATCHRFHGIFNSSRKLTILQEAANAEYGPIEDIIQLLTHNASQPAHIRREAPISEALLHQIIKVGRVAQRYEDIYPFKKWKTAYADRRQLTDAERYLLRRAIYRLWLFDRAFHNSAHVRHCRGVPEVMRERAALLHNSSTPELAEMLDVHVNVLRDLVANNVCPSNGKIRQKFQKCFPESAGGGGHQLLFNFHHLNPYPPPSFSSSEYHNSPLFGSSRHNHHHQSRPTLPFSRWHDPGAEGWGDDISHYYVVEDMMKLDPEQILHLRDNCPTKSQVEAFVRAAMGDWFANNGETFSETLNFVLRQRGNGGDLEELKFAIEDGEVGIALRDDLE